MEIEQATECISELQEMVRTLQKDQLHSEEFKGVILEIAECFKQKSMTPAFHTIVDTYEKEIK